MRKQIARDSNTDENDYLPTDYDFNLSAMVDNL